MSFKVVCEGCGKSFGSGERSLKVEFGEVSNSLWSNENQFNPIFYCKDCYSKAKLPRGRGQG